MLFAEPGPEHGNSYRERAPRLSAAPLTCNVTQLFDLPLRACFLPHWWREHKWRGQIARHQQLFPLQFHPIAPGIQGWTEQTHACVGLGRSLKTETHMQEQQRLNADNNHSSISRKKYCIIIVHFWLFWIVYVYLPALKEQVTCVVAPDSNTNVCHGNFKWTISLCLLIIGLKTMNSNNNNNKNNKRIAQQSLWYSLSTINQHKSVKSSCNNSNF